MSLLIYYFLVCHLSVTVQPFGLEQPNHHFLKIVPFRSEISNRAYPKITGDLKKQNGPNII